MFNFKNERGDNQAILVKVITQQKRLGREDDCWEEIEGLADTAGYQIIHKISQVKRIIDPRFFMGEGKLGELKERIEKLKLGLIIFDNNLNPRQNRNIEDFLGCKVTDRQGLILEIFGKHAYTYEAIIQVELAQLLYALPRLTRRWGHLSRQKGGIGLRDAGEKQLEIDRRLTRKQIDKLKKELKKVDKQRVEQRKKRSEYFIVSLVGYTNAGKSTLMNALTHSNLVVADQLFATLDSTVRIMKGYPRPEILIADTVGFINNLPHHLIASFRSTLGEISLSGLLLKVIDLSHPDFKNQLTVTQRVLEELNLDRTPAFWVFNKLDLLAERNILNELQRKYPQAIFISAKNPQEVEELRQRIICRFEKNMVEKEAELNSAHYARIISRLYNLAQITSIKHLDNLVQIKFKAQAKNLPRINKLLVNIR